MKVIEQKRRYLEFEQPLAELDREIQRLKELKIQGNVDISSEIRTLEEKAKKLLEEIFKDLSAYQVVQLARHPNRPTSLDYGELLFDDFVELRGDRCFREDPSIVGGLVRFQEKTYMFLGHQKGRSTQENMERNFGMPRPEAYRKAYRLMNLAERWNLPLITFVDTPGAFPGIEAEERGQAEAIARNIEKMSGLRVPIVSVILGEGGSGGALGIGVCNRLLMFQYSTFSVISPEGCAAITWKDGSYAETAAGALCLTADQIKQMQVADRVIQEPLGGAHREVTQAAASLKDVLSEELRGIEDRSTDELLAQRYERYRSLGLPQEGAADAAHH